ncbi:MAG: His/Gly/Thr/Pro-type tRNA ligase C-terminal domain-containing protein [Verrucomicrobiales bacterium]
MLRAGLVRKLSGGLYTFLPAGLRVMQKVSQICREEMDQAAAIELAMPLIHPANNWVEGPRWAAAREIMYRVDHGGAGKGRAKEPEHVLGPTHEEIITPLVKTEITRYRDLPKNFYQIGTKYSEKFGAVYTDDQKQSHPMVMGCYGIGISRTLQAVIEQNNDADGIVWPWQIAPWQVLVVNLDPQDAAARDLCAKLAADAEAAGADVLVDDRAERPGVKFKDADLIGLPLRLTVGGKGLKEGIFEFKWRKAKEVTKVPIADADRVVAEAVRQAAQA